MFTPFEVTLLILLAAALAGVIPVLIQIHHAARTLNIFLVSAEKHLIQMGEDVHMTQASIERVSISLRKPIEDLSKFANVVKGTGVMIQETEFKIRKIIQVVSFISGNPFTVLKTFLGVFRTTKKKK